MKDWTFQNPVRATFGSGSRRGILDRLSGRARLLVMTTPGNRRRPAVVEILDSLSDRDPIVMDDVAPNPGLKDLEKKICSLEGVEIGDVVAIGGGSVLDSAKVIAVAVSQPDFDLRGYLFGGLPLPERRNNTLVCCPTTAGTGSEVTPFATIWDEETRRKLSMAGSAVFPDEAILDPELSLSVPREITIMTGLDAVTQAFEATWSCRASAVSTALAVRAIRIGMRTLPRLPVDPDNLELRSDMLEASLLAGLAISSSRTALCHSISYPLTMHLGVPHGLACGFVLPEVLAFNCEVAPAQFEQLAVELGHENAGALEQSIQAWMEMLGVGALLRAQGFSRSGAIGLVSEMLAPGRADNNLRDASVSDVAGIVERALVGRGM